MGIMNYVNSLKETKNKFVKIFESLDSNINEDNTFNELVTHVENAVDNHILPYKVYSINEDGTKCVETPNTNRDFNKPVIIGNSANCDHMFSRCYNFNQPVNIPRYSRYVGMFESTKFNNPININSYGYTDITGMLSGATSFNSDFIFSDQTVKCDNLFDGCINFDREINIPDNISYCSSMFANCITYSKSPYVPKNAINCSHMFWNCRSMTNHPKKIPDSVTDCSYMFGECYNLSGKDWTLNTACIGVNHYCNCARMYYMCNNLSYSAKFPYGNCEGMFWGCNNITRLSCDMKTDELFYGLNSFQVQKITNSYNYSNFIASRSNDRRLDIYLYSSVLNSYFNRSNEQSIVGKSITWTTDSSNECYYNTYYNVYIYCYIY